MKQAMAALVSAKLLGKEIHVDGIVNNFRNVDQKILLKNECFVRLAGEGYATGLYETACKELQVPYALYREGWKKHPKGFSPHFDGVVVRLDHAAQVRRYMKKRFRQQTLRGLVPERITE